MRERRTAETARNLKNKLYLVFCAAVGMSVLRRKATKIDQNANYLRIDSENTEQLRQNYMKSRVEIAKM